MKRSRSDLATDLDHSETSPALKKAKTMEASADYYNDFGNIPPEIWREVAEYCADPDFASHNGGYFATFPLLTTCKSISKSVAELPLWRFLRELKKVTISEEEWTVKNGFADFQWNTRIVYGKTFLRMLNTVSTRLKQRSAENIIKFHRKSIPALKSIEDFIVFESYLNVHPVGIAESSDEHYDNAQMISSLFTLNFSALDSVKLYFFGLTHAQDPEENFAQKIVVVETSHALQKLKTVKSSKALFKALATKLKLQPEVFEQFLLTEILEYPMLEEEVEENMTMADTLRALFSDIEEENYKLADNEKPHPAESILVEVLDQLVVPTLFRNMPAMNLVNAILRSSYKIGAKRFVQLFIEDNEIEDMLPPNFIDSIFWKFIEWRNDSVSVFSIQTKEHGCLTFRLESGLEGFWIGIEFGDRLATARRIPYSRKSQQIVEYQGQPARIDAIQAQCGCERLSRDMFLALLYAISNLDPEQPVYVDPACKTPLELVRTTVLGNEDDGTSDYEETSDDSREDSEISEEITLDQEMKELQDEADQYHKESAIVPELPTGEQ